MALIPQELELGLALLLGSSIYLNQVRCTLLYGIKPHFPVNTALIAAGALALSNLERVVIDSSHIDQKKRGIFDMRETLEPLMALLNQSDLKTRYGNGSGNVRLLLY